MYKRDGDPSYASISEITLESLDTYAKEGRPTGHFLRAVLSNDLMEAMGRADLQSRYTIHAICMYIYNELPAPCWGSPEKVDAWLKQHAERRAQIVNQS